MNTLDERDNIWKAIDILAKARKFDVNAVLNDQSEYMTNLTMVWVHNLCKFVDQCENGNIDDAIAKIRAIRNINRDTIF